MTGGQYYPKDMSQLGYSDHACCLYESKEGFLRVLLPLARRALERGDRVAIVVSGKAAAAALARLRANGAGTREDDLQVIGKGAFLTRGGLFAPDRTLEFCRRELECARAAGRAGLLIGCDLDWVVGKSCPAERLTEYEAKANELIEAGAPCQILCGYSQRMSRELQLAALRSHSLAIIGGEVHRNQFYRPPSALLGRESAKAKLDRWLAMLTQRKRAEEALRESEERFNAFFDQSSRGLMIFQGEPTRIVFANAKFAEFLGCTVEVLLRLSPAEALGLAPGEADLDPPPAGGAQESVLPQPNELRVVRQDGSVRWVELLASQVMFRGQPAVQAALVDITERKQAEEKLHRSERRLRALAERLQTVREEDRIAVARELHDELGQNLTGLKMDLAWVVKRAKAAAELPAREKIVARLQSMGGLVETSMHTVYRIASNLRPGVLDDLGLVPAIEWLGNNFQQRSGTRCTVEADIGELELEPDCTTAVFRICQEALTNVARHANAARVEIELRKQPDGLFLHVRDDGRGISESQIEDTQSLGILGIRERAMLFGGQVTIVGRSGKGTTVTLQIPLKDKRP